MRLKKNPPDFMLFLCVVILLALGIIMVFSSSEYAASYEPFNDPFHFLKRQFINAVVGICAMVFIMNINYQKIRLLAKPALIASFILLILVLVSGWGLSAKGSARWLGFGFMRVQPSEVIKLAMVIYMAKSLSEKNNLIKSFRHGIIPHLAIMGLACALILLQPDLGTAVALAGTTFVMLWAAGARFSHMFLLAVAGLLLVVAAIYLEPYRMERFLAFLDPWQDPQGSGFQTIQSMLALGSGGLIGVGLGAGRAKALYLPERHTDFIFSIVGEELGFIGGALIISLFMFFVWRGLKIAETSPEAFASLLAVGATSMVGLQALINLGVVTGCLPVTGITLPFISYGGSSLVFTLAGVGLLLNVSRYARLNR